MVQPNKSNDLHYRPIFVLCFLVQLCTFVSSANDPTEASTLLKFKSFLSNDTALANWINTTSPCNGTKPIWTGLLCGKDSNTFGLQLQDMGLSGIIDIDSLLDLSALRSISFMNNSFQGPLPSLNKLGALKGLYLSGNQFSGDIPDKAFEGMDSLKKVYLAGNELRGSIPSSLAALPTLMELDLHGNQFTGRIPDFQQQNWVVMDLSDNQLEGPIPASLSNLNASIFSGNKGLCGKPLAPCKSGAAAQINGFYINISLLILFSFFVIKQSN